MKSSLQDPLFRNRLNQLSPASDRLWFSALTVGIVFTLVAAYFFPVETSPSGKFWAYAGLFIRTSLYLSARDTLKGRGGELLYRLFLLGLVAGTFELLVDWGLIHWVAKGKLIYTTGNDVVLLGSPIWMPLAWACVIVELGYPAFRLFGIFSRKLSEKMAALLASLIIGIASGFTVGFYEYFAYRAGLWKYEPAHAMIGNFCALYIPLGEFFMFLFILPIAARAVREEESPLSVSLRSGAFFSLAIAGGYALAYFLLELGR
ncbi:MAG: hypothetical protein U1F57_04560 [bacterium]